MPRAEGTIVINRPLKEVYDFLLNGENNVHWRPSVVAISKVAGTPDGEGAHYKQVCVVGPGNRRVDADFEILEVQTEKLIKFKVIAGPGRPTGTFNMSAEGNSTKLTFRLDLEPQGFFPKLMTGVIQRALDAEIATLPNIKSYLESH